MKGSSRNAVALVISRTPEPLPMFSRAPFSSGVNSRHLNDVRTSELPNLNIVDRVPLARFARPEDVAEAIAFLLDANRSGFINGVSLPVDGGWLADASWNSLRLSTRG